MSTVSEPVPAPATHSARSRWLFTHNDRIEQAYAEEQDGRAVLTFALHGGGLAVGTVAHRARVVAALASLTFTVCLHTLALHAAVRAALTSAFAGLLAGRGAASSLAVMLRTPDLAASRDVDAALAALLDYIHGTDTRLRELLAVLVDGRVDIGAVRDIGTKLGARGHELLGSAFADVVRAALPFDSLPNANHWRTSAPRCGRLVNGAPFPGAARKDSDYQWALTAFAMGLPVTRIADALADVVTAAEAKLAKEGRRGRKVTAAIATARKSLATLRESADPDEDTTQDVLFQLHYAWLEGSSGDADERAYRVVNRVALPVLRKRLPEVAEVLAELKAWRQRDLGIIEVQVESVAASSRAA